MKERQGRCICRREERCRRGGDDKDVRGEVRKVMKRRENKGEEM